MPDFDMMEAELDDLAERIENLEEDKMATKLVVVVGMAGVNKNPPRLVRDLTYDLLELPDGQRAPVKGDVIAVPTQMGGERRRRLLRVKEVFLDTVTGAVFVDVHDEGEIDIETTLPGAREKE